MEKLNPIVITLEDGTVYTLEFSRETAKAAEEGGFKRTDIADKLMTRMEQLFFFAFRMHHPTVSRAKAMDILYNQLGGMSDVVQDRLMDLFNAPYETLVNENGTPKNPKVTVSL